MESVLRGAATYLFFIWVIFRITGKRTLAQITTFDAVLLLIISETTQAALVDDDNSFTNSALLILSMLGLASPGDQSAASGDGNRLTTSQAGRRGGGGWQRKSAPSTSKSVAGGPTYTASFNAVDRYPSAVAEQSHWKPGARFAICTCIPHSSAVSSTSKRSKVYPFYGAKPASNSRSIVPARSRLPWTTSCE